MKLKHGKKYETADGQIVGPIKLSETQGNTPWYIEGIGLYHNNGQFFNGGCKSLDLIRRHYTKPKPAHKLDLKPGDVVELVAWEDVGPLTHALKLTYDGTSLRGDFHNVIRDYSSIPKGKRPLFRVVSRS
jgi:hypothetical protein